MSAGRAATTSATSGQREGRSATADVDLDALAAAYGYRAVSPASLARARQAGEGLSPESWALDAGGGPGRHAAVWVEQHLHSVVLDPSAAMVAQAATLRGVNAVRGVAQAMPFRERSFRLVYFHLSIHYGDWRLALDEAGRVLEEEGKLTVWTLGWRHHQASFLSRWFPSMPAIDAGRFPEPEDLQARLEGEGWKVMRLQDDEQVRWTAGAWAAAVKAGYVSTLQLVTPGELGEGLAAFHEAHPDPDERIEYLVRFDGIVCER